MIINNNSITNEYISIYSLVNKKIYLPIFQRGFAWKPVQTEQIIGDISNLFDTDGKQIYLLDFIWYEEDGKFKLADGQQRLVTINILIKCINTIIIEKKLRTLHMDFFDLAYDETQNNDKYRKFYFGEEGKITAPYKKIYLYLKEYVSQNIDHIDDIINIIKNKIWIYSKRTANVDDAFDVFKQINTGGKPLTKDEIIKTIISQYSQKYNLPIQAPLKDIKKMLISYNKLLNNNIGNFDNIAIMSFLNTNVVNEYENFKKFSDYLTIVKDFQNLPIFNVISYIERTQLLDILYILGMKGINLETNRHYIEDLLLPLCLLSIVQSIKRVNPGGIIKSFYANIIEDVKADKNREDVLLSILNFVNENKDICTIKLSEFNNGLGGTNLSTNYKKAILIMDIIRANTSSHVIVNNINLEHIFPQKPCQKWYEESWPMNSGEQSPLINSIGNYLLLNEEINKKIKNKYITDKKIEYDRIIPHDLTLQTQINTVDFDKFEMQRGDYILKRQYEIASYIKHNFKLGNVFIIDD